MRTAIVAIAGLALLAGCHKTVDKQDAPQPKAAAKKADAKPAGQMKSIEAAMDQIPPQLRVPFQSALSCEIKNRSKGEKAIQITPEYVQDLTARLQKDPSIARC